MSNKVKRIATILVVIVLLLVFGVVGVVVGYNYVISQNQRFDNLKEAEKNKAIQLNADTKGAVMVVIQSGDDTGKIAKNLADKGLIDNPFLFTIMSKFNGFDGGYLAGTHYLLPGLSYDEMMYLLCQEPVSIQITFPEGMTYEQIKAKLIAEGLQFDPEKLDAYMNDPNMFNDYPFISQINGSPDRDLLLSGYLFPDTYNFDVNASEKEIINTFLRTMNYRLYQDFYDRAEKIGMSMDEVITLASLIQSETTEETDMFFISAVFHRRLKSSDPSLRLLQSCASINYLRSRDGLPRVWYASSEDISHYQENKYNTYESEGLPPGPICMPGMDAIMAALYPNNKGDYWYFCATGIDGGTAFAASVEEQNANVEKYRENWVLPTPTPTPTAVPSVVPGVAT